jgi:hypothetical protein
LALAKIYFLLLTFIPFVFFLVGSLLAYLGVCSLLGLYGGVTMGDYKVMAWIKLCCGV